MNDLSLNTVVTSQTYETILRMKGENASSDKLSHTSPSQEELMDKYKEESVEEENA